MSVRVPGSPRLTVGGLLRRWRRKPPPDSPGKPKRRMVVALPGGGPELEPEPDPEPEHILTDNEWENPQ